MKTKLISFLALLISFAFFGQTPQPPSGQKWVTVTELSDEFNQSSIDSNKWDDFHPHWKGRAPSNFKKGNAFVEGGFLKLRSTLLRDPNSVNDKFKDIWVNSAACVSKQNSARVGYYYEARIKASSLSMTSSFWFRVGRFSEIDVIEHIGDPSNDSRDSVLPFEFGTNTHYYGSQAGPAPKGTKWRMPGRGRDNFYVYGMWWKSPNELLFYHNGQQVMKLVPRVPLNENLKMIFDTEVFPFATAGVANIGLPKVENLNNNSKNTMLVDWVRVYKLEEGVAATPVVDPVPEPEIPVVIPDPEPEPEVPVVAPEPVIPPVVVPIPEPVIIPPTEDSSIPYGKIISLRKSNGDRKYVTGENNGSRVIARAPRVLGWERFEVVRHPKGGIALLAQSNKKYIQVPNKDTNGPVRNIGTFIGDWEQFTWKSKGEGKVALQSVYTGRWLQAAWTEDRGIVRARGVSDRGWETFEWKVEASSKLVISEVDLALTVSPNPAINTILVTGTTNVDMQVIGLNGILAPVLITLNSLGVDIDISQLAPGIYFIVSNTGERTKFIKK